MALSGTDSYGAFLDTGVGTAVTPRANVEVEATHTAKEVDSGTQFPSGQTITSFIPKGTPHRPATSPR